MEQFARISQAANVGLALLRESTPEIVQFILTGDDWNLARPSGLASEALQDTLAQALLQMGPDDFHNAASLCPALGLAINEVFERAQEAGYRCRSIPATIPADYNVGARVLIKALHP